MTRRLQTGVKTHLSYSTKLRGGAFTSPRTTENAETCRDLNFIHYGKPGAIGRHTNFLNLRIL